MTTKTAQAPVTTCPPSAVVDQIVPWPEVREGDLVLWDGEFCLVTRKGDFDGLPLFWLDGDERFPHGVLPCGTYAAVRRYTEGGTAAPCDAEDAGYLCTELGSHAVHLARESNGRIDHAWDAEG